jgi:hypothetical protein
MLLRAAAPQFDAQPVIVLRIRQGCNVPANLARGCVV